MAAENFQELMSKCVCPPCPSYNDCARGKKEQLFCLVTKHGCSFNKNGCMCPTCPIPNLKKFSGMYFCVDGKTKPGA